MSVYYNVEIQMAGDDMIADTLLFKVAEVLHASIRDVDECEDHRAVLFFKSDITPTEMRGLVRHCFDHGLRIYYIDVIYRYEYEMTPDRFTIWGDGRKQEYTGRVIFTEDE